MILFFLKASSNGQWIGPLVVISLVFSFVILRIVIKNRGDKQRVKAMELVARQMRWAFTPFVSAADFEHSYTKTFHLTAERNEKDTHIRFNNVMRAQVNGMEVMVFDYHFYHYAYRASTSYEQTMVHFRSPRLNLPGFFLHQNASRTGVAIGRALGITKPDIDFGAHPEFSARYELRGDDEQAIRSVFNNAVLSFYEQTEGTTTLGFSHELLYYRSGKRVAPENIRQFLDEAFRAQTLFQNS